MTKIKQLDVSTPQGNAGRLHKESRFAFNYATTDPAAAISLTMPLRAASYASGALLPIFEMNRPEGYLLSRIEDMLAKHGDLDDMRLLAITGGRQIGRLTYSEPGTAQRAHRAQIGLAEILSRNASAELFEFLVAQYFDSGVSGVQPKVLVPDAERRTPLNERATTVHADMIVKAATAEYPDLAINEFFCMSVARAAGLEVPKFWLSESGSLFVLRRFDLHDERQLGFEDFAVLTNRTTREKYSGSYEQIARALRLYFADADPLPALQRFYEYVVLCVLVRNGDAHLKNFGVLYDDPVDHASLRLAPIYDVVTTSIYDLSSVQGITKYDRTLALKLAKTRSYPGRETMLRFGRDHCFVREPERVIERLCEAMLATWRAHSARAPRWLLEALKREWGEGQMSLQPSRAFMPM